MLQTADFQRDTVAPADTTAWTNPADQVVQFDFGMIEFTQLKKGEATTGRFTFLNVSPTDALEIEIVSACDCITAEWSEGPIPPGQRAEILFELRTSDQDLGPFFKTLDVIFKNTDARGYPLVTQVFVKGEIK
jgi:hypothetical protein